MILISLREIKSFVFRIFRPFQNNILLHSLTSLTCESKFYGTSISVGVLKMCLHLGLGVGLRGKL